MFHYQHAIRLQRRLPSWGPFAVLRGYKNRDGPLIYHRRDGPQWYRFIGLEHNGTGPPEGTGPPAGKQSVFLCFATYGFQSDAKPDFQKVI